MYIYYIYTMYIISGSWIRVVAIDAVGAGAGAVGAARYPKNKYRVRRSLFSVFGPKMVWGED